MCHHKNLFLALRRLRKPDKPRAMWVVALCICQENDKEKSHQVRLMGEIYKRCTKVCIWVGEYKAQSSEIGSNNDVSSELESRDVYKRGLPNDNMGWTFNFLTELAENKHVRRSESFLIARELGLTKSCLVYSTNSWIHPGGDAYGLSKRLFCPAKQCLSSGRVLWVGISSRWQQIWQQIWPISISPAAVKMRGELCTRT